MDGEDHFAFVALDTEDSNEIIAVVHYDREPGEERAEYAALSSRTAGRVAVWE